MQKCRIFMEENHDGSFFIDDSNFHYMKNVLRLKVEDLIDILTPSSLITARIDFMEKRKLQVTAISRRGLKTPDYSFTVYQCILKREYMDTVIEKYTELGVTNIVPVISERSLKELKENTYKRYHEIAKTASLQSEREYLPHIENVMKLKDIKAIDGDNIIFYERAEKSTAKLSSRNVSIIIGSEGGFAEAEVAELQAKGFQVISPINTILKAETAAVVFAGWVMLQL